MEAKFNIKPTVQFTLKTTLTEGELRALDALCGYNIDEFLKCFYTHMGEHYLKPHERDLRDLFTKVRELRPAIHNIDEARKKIGLL